MHIQPPPEVCYQSSVSRFSLNIPSTSSDCLSTLFLVSLCASYLPLRLQLLFFVSSFCGGDIFQFLPSGLFELRYFWATLCILTASFTLPVVFYLVNSATSRVLQVTQLAPGSICRCAWHRPCGETAAIFCNTSSQMASSLLFTFSAQGPAENSFTVAFNTHTFSVF